MFAQHISENSIKILECSSRGGKIIKLNISLTCESAVITQDNNETLVFGFQQII